MKAIKITDEDSTCVEAGFGQDAIGDWVAVPDWVVGNDATFIFQKHGDNIVIVNGVRLKAFRDEDPDVAISEALVESGGNEAKKWWLIQ